MKKLNYRFLIKIFWVKVCILLVAGSNLEYCTMCKHKVTKKGKLYLTKNCPGGQNIGVFVDKEK